MRSFSYLALAAAVGAGSYLVAQADAPAAAPAPVRPPRAATLPAFTATPAPSLPDPDDAALDPLVTDDVDEPEEIRGHDEIVDPAEFAMVFSVDGTSFLRLSAEHRAESWGEPRLVVEDGGVHAVIAPVETAAMPPAFRRWLGRSVLVDGTCRARVVGFAHVSRVAGEAGDPYRYEQDEDGKYTERYEPEEWTVESVTDANITLAAQLDGCTGTWARATDYAPAAIASIIDAPELENAALADLLAKPDDGIDETALAWGESGGEGDWREAADIVTLTWQHPLTNERWVFAQARREGHCGEPGFDVMAAYRAREDGTVQRVADLTYGYQDIREVFDLDGDGQPELLLGGDDQTSELADLANTRHESIEVPYHSYGCGC